MDKSPEAFRTITEVSKWLDTPAHVLRFWESRFPEVSPVKRAGGRRYYRPEDMQILGGIKTMLHDRGQSIKDVQSLLASDGSDGITALSPKLEFADTAPSGATLAPTNVPAPPPADAAGEDESDRPARLDLLDNTLSTPEPAPELDPDVFANPDAVTAPEDVETEAEAEPLDPEDPVAVPDQEDATAQDTLELEPASADAEGSQELELDLSPEDNPAPPADAQDGTEEPPLDAATDAEPEAEPESVFNRFPDRRSRKRAQEQDPVPELASDHPTDPASPAPDTSPFQSRRPRRTDAPVAKDDPKRGFFFNDMAEPALSDVAASGAVDLDRDDPQNYAGFSALNASPLPTLMDTDAPDPDRPAPDQQIAVPSRQTLPKDPPDAPLTWPTPPGITAELRSLTQAEVIAQVGSLEMHEIAGRLHALHARMRGN